MKHQRRQKRILLALLVVTAVILPLISVDRGKDCELQKKSISSVDQLPIHTYKIAGTIIGMLSDDKAFASFAQQVRRDIESDLTLYDIKDIGTLREYCNVLMCLDVIQGRDESALEGIQRLRALADKPAEKLLVGLTAQAMIEARRTASPQGEAGFRKSFELILAEKVSRLPWETVQENINRTKDGVQIVNKNFILGMIQSMFEPGVQKSGFIDGKSAHEIIKYYFTMQEIVPLKEEIVSVYGNCIKTHQAAKRDIWQDRQVDLTQAKNLSPVIVAIWDTGVDISLFPGRLFTNTREKPDGLDNDGNGFVDDIHGIAYTEECNKTPELLYRLQGDSRYFSIELYKGFLDLDLGIDSPEATAVKRKMASMEPEQVNSLMENLNQSLLYAHGTQVAGVTVSGNPNIRLLVARRTGDYHQPAKPLTIELARKNARMFRETVAYFKANGVRVVNMSWGVTLKSIVHELEANGIGKDVTERGTLARKIYDILKKGFYDAIKGAPGVLFVCASGNGNIDPFFEGHLPLSLRLPNIIVVGAVNQAGDKTSISNYGMGVKVYANGYDVETVLPGGQPSAGSGTSLAAPQVTNLAAKLLALAPRLKVEEIVDLIIRGADKSKDGQFLLLNPKHSVELLKAR